MALTTQTKRGLLRKIAREATDEGLTLLSKIQSLADAGQDAALSGDIASTSSNGHSVTWSIDSTSGFGASELADFYSELEDLHTESVDAMTIDETALTDANILAQMLSRLQRAGCLTYDFSGVVR